MASQFYMCNLFNCTRPRGIYIHISTPRIVQVRTRSRLRVFNIFGLIFWISWMFGVDNDNVLRRLLSFSLFLSRQGPKKDTIAMESAGEASAFRSGWRKPDFTISAAETCLSRRDSGRGSQRCRRSTRASTSLSARCSLARDCSRYRSACSSPSGRRHCR